MNDWTWHILLEWGKAVQYAAVVLVALFFFLLAVGAWIDRIAKDDK